MLDQAFAWFLVTYQEEFRRGNVAAFETLMFLSVAHLFGFYNPKALADYLQTSPQRLYEQLKTFSLYTLQELLIRFQVKQAVERLRPILEKSDATRSRAGVSLAADFSVTNTTGRGELTVRFTLMVQNTPIRSVRWTFGDGETSAEVHPEHLYRTPGVYTVRVDVTMEGGQVLSKTKEGFITVSHRPPDVAFSATATSGRSPLTVRFTSTNAGGAVTTSWTFGDGETVSAAQDTITHVYRTAGTYTVSLTATGPGGADTETKTGFITVSQSQSVVAVSPSALSFGGVRAGQSRALTFVVRNGGSATLSVSSVRATGRDTSQFSVSPASFTVNAGDSARVTVTFTPTVGDTLSALLSIAHSAAGSPASVRLTGGASSRPWPISPTRSGLATWPWARRWDCLWSCSTRATTRCGWTP